LQHRSSAFLHLGKKSHKLPLPTETTLPLGIR
jgi:hypothetical protein